MFGQIRKVHQLNTNDVSTTSKPGLLLKGPSHWNENPVKTQQIYCIHWVFTGFSLQCKCPLIIIEAEPV